MLKDWCFWAVVLEKTAEIPFDCKEIQPVNPNGNLSWIFIRRSDIEAEAPMLWPPDTKSWLIGKDRDAGKDWRQEEKGTTEDEMVDAMDVSLSKLWEMVKDRVAGHAAVHGIARSRTWLSYWTTTTKQIKPWSEGGNFQLHQHPDLSLGSGTHWRAVRVACLGDGMEDPPVPLLPSCALDITFMSLFLRCIFYNKQQNVSKAFSWIQWIVQVNTKTWGVGCGIPQVYRHLVRVPGTCYWCLKWGQFEQMSPWPGVWANSRERQNWVDSLDTQLVLENQRIDVGKDSMSLMSGRKASCTDS